MQKLPSCIHSIPECNLKSFGQRCFSFFAPSVWKPLPASAVPVCEISPLCLNPKPGLRLSSLDMPFHKPGQTIPVSVGCVYICVYVCLNGVGQHIAFLLCKDIFCCIFKALIQQKTLCMSIMIIMSCGGYTRVEGSGQADRLGQDTRGLCRRNSEMLRSLRHCLQAQN